MKPVHETTPQEAVELLVEALSYFADQTHEVAEEPEYFEYLEAA